ncbi:uncharacterized protein LOC129592577 [Paramacrobiotus metropolitanus]|uniref:uncharacterized protein LOC129592577 n=1 Tax=Paramacrobiotus metropolitanus TaxID=2943436 RepID=UPI002445C9C9|nr:uncharacterized protein LOC129592577 [Paramacrobiotus metropolitanus]
MAALRILCMVIFAVTGAVEVSREESAIQSSCTLTEHAFSIQDVVAIRAENRKRSDDIFAEQIIRPWLLAFNGLAHSVAVTVNDDVEHQPSVSTDDWTIRILTFSVSGKASVPLNMTAMQNEVHSTISKAGFEDVLAVLKPL